MVPRPRSLDQRVPDQGEGTGRPGLILCRGTVRVDERWPANVGGSRNRFRTQRDGLVTEGFLLVSGRSRVARLTKRRPSHSRPIRYSIESVGGTMAVWPR